MPVPAYGSRRAREGASSEAEMSPRARRSPLEGGVSPRSRQNLLEGAVSPRARRNLLEGAFDWATPVGRGGHRSVGRALCVRLSERCVLFLFFAGFKRDSPGFLGPSGLSRQVWNSIVNIIFGGTQTILNNLKIYSYFYVRVKW
jgi:hypothetical protein